ncbi:MAG TPA: hypothetical protein VEA78_08445 [Acidimicrobiales bacterium]|nr:hypothetical protein [Acidimicrobiales bacterium]
MDQERPDNAERDLDEGDPETVDRAIAESPAKGLIDEGDPDPPEPSEPG